MQESNLKIMLPFFINILLQNQFENENEKGRILQRKIIEERKMGLFCGAVVEV